MPIHCECVLSMRLSNLKDRDPEMYAKAVAQFKDAAADLSKTISEDADIMEIVQNNGWDDYSGPYTRSYNQHCLSGTLANLMTNLGGISIQEQRPDIAASYIKDADYLGKRFEKHFVLNLIIRLKDIGWTDFLKTWILVH